MPSGREEIYCCAKYVEGFQYPKDKQLSIPVTSFRTIIQTTREFKLAWIYLRMKMCCKRINRREGVITMRRREMELGIFDQGIKGKTREGACGRKALSRYT